MPHCHPRFLPALEPESHCFLGWTAVLDTAGRARIGVPSYFESQHEPQRSHRVQWSLFQHQPGRFAEWRDLLFDAVGALIGTIGCWAWGILSTIPDPTAGHSRDEL